MRNLILCLALWSVSATTVYGQTFDEQQARDLIQQCYGFPIKFGEGPEFRINITSTIYTYIDRIHKTRGGGGFINCVDPLGDKENYMAKMVSENLLSLEKNFLSKPKSYSVRFCQYFYEFGDIMNFLVDSDKGEAMATYTLSLVRNNDVKIIAEWLKVSEESFFIEETRLRDYYSSHPYTAIFKRWDQGWRIQNLSGKRCE